MQFERKSGSRPMLTLKFLHIAAMFSAVTLAYGTVVVLAVVARAGDIQAYRRLDALTQRTDMASIGLFLAGIIFGFLTALTGGFDLTASWLILAYILVAVVVIEGIVFSGRWLVRLRNAANLQDAAAAAEEVRRLSRTRGYLASLVISPALMIAIIYVMVTKPALF